MLRLRCVLLGPRKAEVDDEEEEERLRQRLEDTEDVVLQQDRVRGHNIYHRYT